MNESILGTNEKAIDKKYRILLPSYYNTIPQEELVLILRSDHIEVRERQKVLIELNKLIEKIENANDLKIKEYYKTEKNILTASITKVVEVDNYGRITLRKNIVEYYNLTEGITLEGIVDGFRIWNTNKFLEYQNELINKHTRK